MFMHSEYSSSFPHTSPFNKQHGPRPSVTKPLSVFRFQWDRRQRHCVCTPRNASKLCIAIFMNSLPAKCSFCDEQAAFGDMKDHMKRCIKYTLASLQEMSICFPVVPRTRHIPPIPFFFGCDSWTASPSIHTTAFLSRIQSDPIH